MATSLNNLAVLYDAQGKYGEAEPLYQRALAIREKALGSGAPGRGHQPQQPGITLSGPGKVWGGGAPVQTGPGHPRKGPGAGAPGRGQSLNNLSALYRQQGKHGEVEPLYKRALAIREKALGPEHSHVANSLNNLAALYYAQGKYVEAEPLFKRTLAILEKALGPEHPDVATCLENYAALLKQMGRGAEAEPLEARARAIRARQAEKNPPK